MGLRSLKTLIMNNNIVHTIEQSAFQSFKNLQELNLANNRLSWANQEYIASPFQSTTALRKLCLRNNSITNFLSEWNEIHVHLNDLDLSYNNITSISSYDLNFLSNYIQVNLTNNHIVDVNFNPLMLMLLSDRQENKVRNGHKIYLEHNPLACTCHSLAFNQYLRDQNSNFIQIIPGDLRCASPAPLANRLANEVHPRELLCPLDSLHTGIKYCPEKCDCNARTFDSCIMIDCSNRSLEFIPHLPLPSNVNLKFIELSVQNNNLQNLPNILNETNGYNYVTKLNAANNTIATLHTNNIPPNITELNLSGNRLTSINKTVLATLSHATKLKNVLLSNNPWKCDCDARSLLIFSKDHFSKMLDLKLIRCSDGRLFQENGIDDLCPESQTVVIAVSIVMALLGCCIGMLAAFYYKYQQEIKVWLFANNLLTCLVTEHELDVDKKYDAFVSYSHHDMDFVAENIVRALEGMSYKICFHERDWPVGNPITQSVSSFFLFCN